MAAKPDYVRDVMFRWIRRGAIIGAFVGAIPGLLWGFDYPGDKATPSAREFLLFLAFLGAFLAYLVTGLLGLVRWLFLGYE